MIYDIDQHYIEDFNKKTQYYLNDHPDQWSNNWDHNYAVYDKEFYYEFNTQGYRCDEFDNHSELPVVFLGCSNTFGLGLPMQKVWAFKLLEKIRQKTKKSIPYWNLAKNGASIELQYLCLENHIKKLKPKYVFFQVPNIYRKCIYFEKTLHQWLVSEQPHIDNFRMKNFLPLFVDQGYALYETKKLFSLISSLCKEYNATVFFNYQWTFDNRLYDKVLEEKKELDQYIQSNLKEFRCSLNKFILRYDYARDRAHDGPLFHQVYSDSIWNNIEYYFNNE